MHLSALIGNCEHTYPIHVLVTDTYPIHVLVTVQAHLHVIVCLCCIQYVHYRPLLCIMSHLSSQSAQKRVYWFEWALPIYIVCTCMCLWHRSIHKIHPKFRVIGIGEPQKQTSRMGGVSSTQTSWLHPELLSMFPYHHVKPLPREEERKVILSKVR